jgi:starch synthase (maltosyl-transferring)
MRPAGNDRWEADLALPRTGRWLYTIEAWRDAFGTYRDELGKKHAAGVDVRLELIEGCEMVSAAAARVPALRSVVERLARSGPGEQAALLLAASTAALMAEADQRAFAVRLSPPCPIDADRPIAGFASWYELFPRSMSDDPERHGTFADVIRHLPRIRAMGFDVLYFPPIHPIGSTNRKGRNNSLRPAPEDPGSPYAIGSAAGGHDAIEPALGTLDDFRRLREAAAAAGLELALDFAIQCSPDHPWLTQHREWFDWRPDGSVKHAENPPKKYEDIVNVAFYATGAVPDLWVALAEVVLFWARQGVRIFRVDNPHTKSFPFWEWLIGEVRAAYPDAIFLAEAFTRPKIMKRLAKLGFTQSYTYFTWRNTKRELQDYLTELTTTDAAEYMRPNFFVNTPDINPYFLQTSGRPGFLVRAALAATLSGLWGVYSGFELCEAAALPGREEYRDSEKYQIRAWDWARPGNIVAEIAQLNRIRRHNPALHSHLGLSFLPCGHDQLLVYEKATADRSNVVLVAVGLDPHAPAAADVELPLWKWGLPDHGALLAENLLAGTAETWRGKWRRIALAPDAPYSIWRLRPAS